jgi:hypothetical protein
MINLAGLLWENINVKKKILDQYANIRSEYVEE